MYSHASDENTGTLLGVFSGVDTDDRQYEQSLDVMNRIDRLAAARGLPFTYIVVVDSDVPRPPAVWRKRFSDANYGVKSERFYFAMITTSMLMRGVYTAVNWLTAKRRDQFYNVASNIEDVQHWLQQVHAVTGADLVALEQQARRGVQKQPGVGVRPV